MALTNCPECNRQISNQALSCPGCAHPLAPPPPLPTNSAFGPTGPAITVRPDFWHDPNVGAIGGLIAFVLIVIVGTVFFAIFH